MNNKKTVTVGMVALAVVAAGFFSANRVMAADVVEANHMSTLVQKIAQKFGLNQAEVQAVFDANRQEKKAAMEAKFEQKLTADVASGAITEAQKQLILSKRKELQAQHEAMRQSMDGKTMEEHKKVMDAKRQELETWATQNGIDAKYLMGGMGHFKGFGHMGRRP